MPTITRDTHLPDIMTRVICSLGHAKPYNAPYGSVYFVPEDSLWTISSIGANAWRTIAHHHPQCRRFVVLFANDDNSVTEVLPYNNDYIIAGYKQTLGSQIIPSGRGEIAYNTLDNHIARHTTLALMRSLRKQRTMIPILVPTLLNGYPGWIDKLTSIINASNEKTVIIYIDTLGVMIPRNQILDTKMHNRSHTSTLWKLFYQRCITYNLAYQRLDIHTTVRSSIHETLFDTCVIGY